MNNMDLVLQIFQYMNICIHEYFFSLINQPNEFHNKDASFM